MFTRNEPGTTLPPDTRLQSVGERLRWPVGVFVCKFQTTARRIQEKLHVEQFADNSVCIWREGVCWGSGISPSWNAIILNLVFWNFWRGFCFFFFCLLCVYILFFLFYFRFFFFLARHLPQPPFLRVYQFSADIFKSLFFGLAWALASLTQYIKKIFRVLLDISPWRASNQWLAELLTDTRMLICAKIRILQMTLPRQQTTQSIFQFLAKMWGVLSVYCL